jgi:hypothetical protein
MQLLCMDLHGSYSQCGVMVTPKCRSGPLSPHNVLQNPPPWLPWDNRDSPAARPSQDL